MDKAKEISALWEQVKTQVGKLVGLCCEVEDHYEVTADAYQRGYETAKHECNIQAEKDLREVGNRHYQKGLNDAWECARTIFCTSHGELERIFDLEEDNNGLLWVYHEYTASEAIEKIRQYEQEKEEQIQVGDEIETPSGLKGYVVNFTDDELVHYVSSEGRFGTVGMSAVSKTGRHFPEIAEVLAKMKKS